MPADSAPIRPHGAQRLVLSPCGPATFQADQPAGGTVPYVLDCAACTISRWTADAAHVGGALLRPTSGRETGFVYLASAGGQSGPIEPAWPTTAGSTVIDGSMTLTAVPAPVAGEDVIASVTWTQVDPPDSELTISGEANDSLTASAFIGGGTSGNVYTVQAVITMTSSAVYVASLALTVV